VKELKKNRNMITEDGALSKMPAVTKKMIPVERKENI
jgi:hypothetical protein